MEVTGREGRKHQEKNINKDLMNKITPSARTRIPIHEELTKYLGTIKKKNHTIVKFLNRKKRSFEMLLEEKTGHV